MEIVLNFETGRTAIAESEEQGYLDALTLKRRLKIKNTRFYRRWE